MTWSLKRWGGISKLKRIVEGKKNYKVYKIFKKMALIISLSEKGVEKNMKVDDNF